MTESNSSEDGVSYWTEWSDFDDDGILRMKVTGLDDGAIWTGVTEFSPADDDYDFWRWVVSDRRRRKGIKRLAEIESLRAKFAKATWDRPAMMPMKWYQFSLMSFLLLCGAIPIWILLTAIVSQSPASGGGISRFVVAPLVLSGITAAIHRLLRTYHDAWAISALAAAVIALSSLHFAAWLSG